MKPRRILRVAAALFVMIALLNPPLRAEEMPKTLEDMWKIIQTQQKEIETLKRQSEDQKRRPRVASQGGAGKDSNVEELERKTDILAVAVEKLRTKLVIPDEPELKSKFGLGPAASKVYGVEKGLSIGGYGEGRYQNFVNDRESKENNADLTRFVMYIGYKFTDNILFNSEIEFEHATTGEGAEEKGEVSVEFAALDFFIDPMANVRAGLVLVPMGFLNLIHEPPFYFGNNRPEVERRIIPSTWRENGVGLFGQLLPGLTYTTYVVNGLDARGFSSKGIRGGRQSGSKARAEDLAFVGRMDYAPQSLPGLSFGGSAYLGRSGQGLGFDGKKEDVFTQLYEAHVQWKYRDWEFRTLGAWGHIDNASALSAEKGETIGKTNFGWYTELGYNILPVFLPDTTQYLAPFFRFEMLDPLASVPDGFADVKNLDRKIYQLGLHYKPIPNVVIKADYRNFTAEEGSVADEFNLGIGFIF